MTCCPVGKHPSAADIDRMIRAQQAATQSGQSTLAPSYSHIARTYGIRKATLLTHRDVCLVQRTGTPAESVPVRSDAVPERTADAPNDGIRNDSARSDRYGVSVPARYDEGANAQAGRATGPPGGVGQRGPGDGGAVDTGAGDAGARSAEAGDAGARSAEAGDAGVAVGVGRVVPAAGDADVRSSGRSDAEGVGQTRPPERSRPAAEDRARARARESGRMTWDKMAHQAVQQAAHNLANATHDIAIRDPSVRAHASYVEEIAELVQSGEWEDERTVQRLTRAWQKSRLFVLQCHRDACTLIRIARGTRFEQIESSIARWMRIFNTAISNEDPEAQRVAAEAAKGIDRVLGLVDAGTKVQINIEQDPRAQEFVRRILVTLQRFPDALDAVRQDVAQFAATDPTAILTTGAEVDAAE